MVERKTINLNQIHIEPQPSNINLQEEKAFKSKNKEKDKIMPSFDNSPICINPTKPSEKQKKSLIQRLAEERKISQEIQGSTSPL